MYIIIYYTNYSRIIGLLEENINSILNCLGKDINDEIYKNSLKTLFVVGMGDQQFIAIINGGLLNLYSNIWSIFESSINSLFGIIFPEKDSKKKDEEFLNICNILGVSYKEVGNEDKEKIIKKLKDYPFTNKLGSIIALCGSYKSKYEEDDKKLLDNIYQIRNSQHSRGVGKNGEIKIISDLNEEIVKLVEFIGLFEKILNNSGINIDEIIVDPISEIIEEKTKIK